MSKSMNASNLKKPSETDWPRIDAMEDKDIDTSDIPPLADTFFANAELRLPGNKISVSVDAEAHKEQRR